MTALAANSSAFASSSAIVISHWLMLTCIYHLPSRNAIAYIYGMKKNKRKPGPPKVYSVRIVLPLAPNMIQEIEQALAPQQGRVEFIREAIAAALKKRKRKT